MSCLVRLENIFMNYEEGELTNRILKGVTLSVNEGEFISITGASGSGKTTLLNILGLLEKPSSGKYFFESKNVADYDFDSRAKLRNKDIGIVFQSFNLIDELNVLENVCLPLRYSEKNLNQEQIHQKGIECLKLVGLDSRWKDSPTNLSGGQQQRVSIARSLVTTPRMVLLDEPTGNLDSTNSNQIMDILDDLHSKGVTICLITHESEFAKRAGKIIEMSDGCIVNVKDLEI